MANETNPPSGGSGSDIVKLGLSVDATQPEQAAAALDKLAAATIPAAAGLTAVSEASQLTQAAVNQSNAALKDHLAKMQDLIDKAKKAGGAEAELEKARLAAVDSINAMHVKLQEQVLTFGKGTAELMRYRAAQLGVTEAFEPLIKRFEELEKAHLQSTIQQKRDIELHKDRTKAENEAAAATEKWYNNQFAVIEKDAANRKAIEEKRDVEAHNMRAKEQADIEKWYDAQFSSLEKHNANIKALGQKRDKEEHDAKSKAAKDLKVISEKRDKDEFDARTKAASDAKKIAEKLSADEVDFSHKTLKQKIDLIDRFKAYQAAGLNEEAITGKLRNSAVGNHVGDLPYLMKQYEQALKDVESAHGHGVKAGKSYADMLAAVNFNTSRVRTEMVVVAHEMVQGRFSRIPASLMVFAEYANLSALATSALGLTVIGLAIGTGVLTVEMVKGIIELNKFEKSLNATGNMAGLTRDRVHEMAQRLESGATGGVGKATEMLSGLAATGRFSQETIEQVGRAALNFAHMTGESSEKVISMFAGMESGVHKWNLKNQETYHHLSLAQLEHIKQLEDQGRKQDAMTESAKAFADHLDDHNRKVGTLVQYYRDWATGIDRIIDGLRKLGQGPTIKDQLKTYSEQALNAQKEVRIALGIGKDDPFSSDDVVKSKNPFAIRAFTQYMALKNQVDSLSQQLKVENDKANNNAELADARSEGAASLTRTEHLVKSIRNNAEKRKDAIAEADRDAAGLNRARLTEELSKRGISYNAIVEQAVKADQAVTTTEKLGGLTRTNARRNEFDEQLKIADQYGIKLRITTEQRAQLEAAAAEKYKDKKGPNTNDGRKQDLLGALTAVDAEFQITKTAIDGNMRLLHEAKQHGLIENETYYATLRVERDNELAALKQAYNLKIDLLNNYQGRNAVDSKEAAKRIQEVVRAYLKAKADIENAGVLADLKETTDAKKVTDKHIGGIDKNYEQQGRDLDSLIAKQIQHNEAIGKSKSQIEAEKAAHEEATTSILADERDAIEALLLRTDLSAEARKAYEAELAGLNKIIEKRSYLRTLQDFGAVGDAEEEKIKNYTKHLSEAVEQARKFERGMQSAFGSVGKAIGEVTVALAEYAKRQNQIELDKKKALDAAKTPEERAAAEIKARDESTTNYLGSMASMADASKNFFDKNSQGYKDAEGVAKAFHTAQMALTAIEMVQNAYAAVAKASAQFGIPGLIIMTGAMVGLGLLAGGHFNTSAGDATTAKERQQTQGAGTVLGDTPTDYKDDEGKAILGDDGKAIQVFTQKSESIKKSLELLQKNSDATMPVSHAMLKSLQNIEQAVSGLAVLMFRTAGIAYGNTTGVTTGTLSKNSGDPIANALGINQNLGLFGLFKNDPILGGIIKTLQGFWGKVTREISDSGIMSSPGTVGQYAGGQGFGTYANVQTVNSSWFGLKKDTSNQMFTNPADAQMAHQFGVIFSNVVDTLSKAATPLGYDSQGARDVANSIQFSGGYLSLRGLKGKDLEDAINAYISNMTDQIAHLTLPKLDEFQQVGESYFQTTVRVANGIEQADSALDKLGIHAIKYTDIVDKQGDVGAEIVRQSVLAVEGMSGVGKIMQDVTGDAKALGDEYKKLLDIRRLMSNTGLNGQNLSVNTIKGAGGQDELASGLTIFKDKYFSDEEKLAMSRKNLAEDLNKLGIYTVPQTRDEFKKLVQGIDTSTESGQKLQGQLLGLVGEFEDATTATESLKSAWQSLTDSIMDEVKKIREAMGINGASSYAKAQADFDIATAQARAGDQEAAGKLPQLAEALLKLAENNAETAQQLNAIRGAIANSLETTGKGYVDKYGVKIPGFADGGDFYGGMRLVGENGPELEMTGPSRILNSSQLQGMLMGGLKEEIRALRQELSQLRSDNNAQQRAIARNTERMQKVLTRNDTGNGILITDTLTS